MHDNLVRRVLEKFPDLGTRGSNARQKPFDAEAFKKFREDPRNQERARAILAEMDEDDQSTNVR